MEVLDTGTTVKGLIDMTKIFWNSVMETLDTLASLADLPPTGPNRPQDDSLYDLDEYFCQLFDDTGLGDALESNRLPDFLGQDLQDLFRKLDELCSRQETHLDEENSQEQIEKISALSRRILDHLKDRLQSTETNPENS